MTVRRILALIALAVSLAAGSAWTATPAHAQKLIGCDSKIQWPCPGPAPFYP